VAEYPAEIDVFARRAREYCEWCRRDKSALEPRQFQYQAMRHLSDVLSALLHMPAADFVEAPDAPSPTREERVAIRNSVSPAPFREYWEVFSPTGLEQSDPVVCNLIDDLAETYFDLDEGLWLYDRGHIRAAAWEWWFGFGVHWGRHVTSALRALVSYESASPAGEPNVEPDAQAAGLRPGRWPPVNFALATWQRYARRR
jgi:hypothetical protein